LGDRNLEFEAARAAAVFSLPDAWSQRQTLIKDLVEGDWQGVSPRNLASILFPAQRVYLDLGRRVDSDRVIQQLASLAEKTHDDTVALIAEASALVPMVLDGNLEEACRKREDLVTNQSHGTIALGNLVGPATRALVYLGRAEELNRRVEEFARSMGVAEDRVAPAQTLRILAGITEGNSVQAESAFNGFWQRHGEKLQGLQATMLDVVLEGALALGKTKEVEELSRQLAPAADSFSNLLTSVRRHLGRAARLAGQLPEARSSYEMALAHCNQIHHRPELALTRLDLAELLLEHYPGEREAAIEHLDFAIAELQDMKMQPALERALRHRGLLKA
jgi:hypothetical protein